VPSDWLLAIEAERPEPEPERDGGGGTTLLPGVLPDPPRIPLGSPFEVRLLTVGGGDTTSCVPKTFPIKELSSPVCAGGGGTTFLDGSG
jgi:hypothetical protein